MYVRLADWAERIAEMAKNLDSVYIYFNNDIEGFALKNAATIRDYLIKSKQRAGSSLLRGVGLRYYRQLYECLYPLRRAGRFLRRHDVFWAVVFHPADAAVHSLRILTGPE